MFLVPSQRLSGTIECFAASGNRFPANEKGLRRCRSPLLEGLSLMCADPVFVVRGRLPQKWFVRAIVACHGIVKDKNDARRRMFLFFPIRDGCADHQTARGLISFAAFSRQIVPDKERTPRRPIVSADGVSRRPRIARTHGHADPSAEPAASWSSRFGP
ncbi:MAG TPA: hypothetical protein VF901_13045 [Bradyrhizobium sp.]